MSAQSACWATDRGGVAVAQADGLPNSQPRFRRTRLMPGAATSGQWSKCVARGGLARALSSALADLGGRATPVRGYYADLSNTRSADECNGQSWPRQAGVEA